MNQAAIDVRCEDLFFRYREGSAGLRFDCTFVAGEITALLGPSGSGKSTLLNLVAGFEKAETGRMLFAEMDLTGVPASERPVSMIFQENNLFAHLSVFDNVGLGISPSLRLDQGARDGIEDGLAAVGLGGFGGRLPSELSGGERQRVALARAMVRNRPVLLLDEAFASLGPALRGEMLDLLARLRGDRAMTTIMVTHSPDDARRIAGRTVFLAAGAVAAEGNTQDVLAPNDAPPAVRDYLGVASSDGP